MSYEITGKVIHKSAPVTGTGANGEWKKQEFVIETEERYPVKVSFSAWKEQAEIAGKLNEGDRVKVSFDISSREYQSKWYTELRAWKIEAPGVNSGLLNSPKPDNFSIVGNALSEPSAPSQPTGKATEFDQPGPDRSENLPF